MNYLLLITIITFFAMDIIDATCTETMPTDGTFAVQISFYKNTAGGNLGDTCPSSCMGDPVMTKWYPIAPKTDVCSQWPGNSGTNSMKNGRCDAASRSYSYDQWTNCDCSNNIGASKIVFID